MTAAWVAYHAWVAVGPLSVGYWAGRTRPWRRLSDWTWRRCHRPPRSKLAQLALALLVAVTMPSVARRALRIGWREWRKRRSTVAPSDDPAV